MKKMLMTMAAVAMVSVAAPASAVVSLNFDEVGDSFKVTYDGFGGDPAAVIGALSAEITYTLTAIDGLNWTFDYEVKNTSTATTSRVSVMAFDVDPDAVASIVDGFFTDIVTDKNIPNSGTREICFKASGGNSCSGGGGEGVAQGGTASGTFNLAFDSAPDPAIFSTLVVRYQSITGLGSVGSAIGRGQTSVCVGDNCDPPGGGLGGVPEPATWAMMIMGFGAAGTMLRRRRTVLG